MKAVAYCRVSTNKDEQLDSLEAQQVFFTEYTKKNGYHLVQIYADEGKSGTKMKNRTQLLKLLSDANRGMFDIVLIKDVSRLARNTVDFLTSIRKLKSLGVKVIFVNYDQTSSDSSEFMLTMLSAIAQEESANTSKRVKFGKRMNAEKGRVPNFVYGYDKIIGDYFNLQINEAEAQVVKRIFDMYTEQNYGASKIAIVLNREGLLTKRKCKWSQTAVARILTNEIYIGNIINGKQEVADFLTGKRTDVHESSWMKTHRPELRILDDATFEKAKVVLEERKDTFHITGERNSERHIFSKLIKCTCCGSSFRQYVRTYQNTYVRWICTGRNTNGVDSCPNKTVLDESELLNAIREYFTTILKNKPQVIKNIVSEFTKQYKAKNENQLTEKELSGQLTRLNRSKQKYMDMYDNDVISMDELREKTKELNESIRRIEEDLKCVNRNISKSDLLENILAETFRDMESLLKAEHITNNVLARIIEKITVDEHGNVDVYLKLLSDVGLDDTVLLSDNQT